MIKFQNKKVFIGTCESNLCPKINNLMEDIKLYARDYASGGVSTVGIGGGRGLGRGSTSGGVSSSCQVSKLDLLKLFVFYF